MEFFRRLRIIWTALSVIAAALVGIAYMGNPAGVPLAWFFAAVVSAVCFHIDGGVKVQLSVLWLVGFGLLAYGAFSAAAHDPSESSKALIRTVALTLVPWLVAATVMWLVGGLRKSKNTS
jgi:uncharacterized membrane protein AbrB (regulator of aidB expression)